MSKVLPEMTSHDVVAFLTLCQDHAIELWIDGGWAVDALLEVQTRVHGDLDIALNHNDVPKLRALLEERGYRHVPRDDTSAYNFVLGDDHGHVIDFHSFIFDDNGNCIFGCAYPFDSFTGSGTIDGHQVKCISPQRLVEFHTGYELREKDHRDVVALCDRFGLELPKQHQELLAAEQRASLIIRM